MSKSQNPSTARSISASEIARNLKFFETWCSYNGCQKAGFSDFPNSYRADANIVFGLDGKLPEAVVNKSSDAYESLKESAPGLLKFLSKAKSERPALFSEACSPENHEDIVEELSCVYTAWKKLNQMKDSKERWSEADFAANVYNLLRSSALRKSSYRTQCSVHLPRHHNNKKTAPASQKIISTRNVIPDGSLFIPSELISRLSSTRKSPYNVINDHPSTKQSCGLDGENTFRYQATPTSRPQSTPCFEFAGAFVEDKKPGSEAESLDHAYRQNRMSCTAALRHIHALRVSSPVFGVIWADGKVRAHCDWFSSRKDKNPAILSAMYDRDGVVKEAADDTTSPSAASSLASQESSKTEATDDDGPSFSEWDLSKPADILCVFFLLRNLDNWITTTFKGRVERGVRTLSRAIAKDGETYRPWRHEDVALRPKQVKKGKMPLRESSNKQRVSLTSTTTTQSTLSLYR